MKRHLAYLKAVLRHKWFVFQACRRLRVPLLIAIFHDWDKFTPFMWFSYAKTFYNPDGSKRPYERGKESVDFMKAWKNHQQINKHHWQYWLMLSGERLIDTNLLMMDSGALKAIMTLSLNPVSYTVMDIDLAELNEVVAKPMPDLYIREMLADWIGAGMAYGNPDVKGWYEQNKDKMKLHPRTRMYLQVEMANYLHKFPVK